MDNSLKTKEKTPKRGANAPPEKAKPNPFLIGKELKTKDLRKTAERRASGPGTKTRIKTPDSLRREASQAAGAAPTLRYGPAGDSAPRLRLKASGMAEKVPFRPVHTARTERPQEKTGKPDRKTQESGSRWGGRSNSSRSRSRSRKLSSPFMRRALRSGSVWVTCSM